MWTFNNTQLLVCLIVWVCVFLTFGSTGLKQANLILRANPPPPPPPIKKLKTHKHAHKVLFQPVTSPLASYFTQVLHGKGIVNVLFCRYSPSSPPPPLTFPHPYLPFGVTPTPLSLSHHTSGTFFTSSAPPPPSLLGIPPPPLGGHPPTHPLSPWGPPPLLTPLGTVNFSSSCLGKKLLMARTHWCCPTKAAIWAAVRLTELVRSVLTPASSTMFVTSTLPVTTRVTKSTLCLRETPC